MKSSKLLNRIKAAITCASVAVTALVAPLTVTEEHADAAVSINYAKALQYSLYLYDANMCGPQAGEKSQLDWRDDCHTYDSSVSTPYGTMDLSGGFHDAGDHVKFGLPAAYSATMLGWGYYEFKDAYTKTGQAAHLQTITDYFCDYFKRCTVMNGSSVQAFCYQVGDGDTDHAKWESPESQTIARPAYFATSSNPCTDVVAETAAALAMNYINFGKAEDLTYAKALYEFAKSNNKSNHQSQTYYTGTCYLDDLALASILLYKATNNSSYKTDCASWISQSNYAYTSDYPLNWDSVWPAVNTIYANEWNRVSANIDTNKNNHNTSQGYACRDDWGSARYNTATQLVGLVYDKYNSSSTYTSWAKGQMEYLFGNNTLGKCYMVGYDSNSVVFPHHRAASGYSDFPSENKGVAYKNILVGALVGGPNKSDNYIDDANEYKYTEVAIDYNAAFVGALAGLYLKYGAGQSVASSVPGVSGSEDPKVTTAITTAVTTAVTTKNVTTATTVKTTDTTTITSVTAVNQTTGTKVVNVNKNIETKGIVQVKISDLLPEGAKAEKFIVNISANGNIGSPSINGGINVTSNEDYWLDLEGTQKISGNSGTVEFDVKSIQNDIQTEGVFQVGYWWGDQSTLKVDSIICIYSTTSFVQLVTTVSTKPITTQMTTTVTTKTVTAVPSSGTKTVNLNESLDYSSDTKKVVQVKIADLLPEGAKAEKFIVNISANGNIGNPSIGGGISVTSNDDSWLDLTGKQNISGSSGTIEFDVKNIQNDIQTEGVFQVGYWWGDQNPLTVDSISCVYSMNAVPTTTSNVTTISPNPSTTVVTTTKTSGGQDVTVPNVNPTKYGDTNLDEDVNVADVVKLNMFLLNNEANKLEDVAIANADCVRDGIIDSSDSALIMNYVAMMIPQSELGK